MCRLILKPENLSAFEYDNQNRCLFHLQQAQTDLYTYPLFLRRSHPLLVVVVDHPLYDTSQSAHRMKNEHCNTIIGITAKCYDMKINSE